MSDHHVQGFETVEQVLTNSMEEQNDFTKSNKKNLIIQTVYLNTVMIKNKLVAVTF